jgi:hypothetical protein
MHWQGLCIRVGWVIRCVGKRIRLNSIFQEKSEVCYENGTRAKNRPKITELYNACDTQFRKGRNFAPTLLLQVDGTKLIMPLTHDFITG